MDVELPLDKLSLKPIDGHVFVVLLATGSFNPPTFMHMRMFELARDALNSDGFCFIGGYMPPVNDAYKKKGLISAEHRLQLCDLACRSSSFVMVDPSEAKQTIQSCLCESGLIRRESLKTMLLCVWIPEQIRALCRDYGIVCIRREGAGIEKIISGDEILNAYQNNIRVVDELIPNQISSTRMRECISRGLSIKYLTVDEVIGYIRQHNLYLNSDANEKKVLARGEGRKDDA
ncbi:hypothetical protein MKX01_018227 [Papaver californicum]|nr:hypothetical protein MKX01_018227 [Papaver californicum]